METFSFQVDAIAIPGGYRIEHLNRQSYQRSKAEVSGNLNDVSQKVADLAAIAKGETLTELDEILVRPFPNNIGGDCLRLCRDDRGGWFQQPQAR